MASTTSSTQQTLNCIVDDSALIAGLRDGETNNLKQWINSGLINIFVPLYTLERLSALRTSISPLSLDAQKALQWLDNITTWTENKALGRVQLQGPDDQYQSWKEVESYLLPDTPLSLKGGSDSMDSLSKVLDENLFVGENDNDGSTARSDSRGSGSELSATPEQVKASLVGNVEDSSHVNGHRNGTMNRNTSPRATPGVPARVRPLLNFVVWRTHHREPTDQSSSIYILLTNDPIIQKQAGKFGVRAKLLDQVRNIVSRDAKLVNGNNVACNDGASDATTQVPPILGKEHIDDDDDEVVVYNPAQRPRSSAGPVPDAKLIDPDHFGRGPNPRGPSNTVPTRGSPQSARGFRGPPRGSFSPRGRGGPAMPMQPTIGPAIYRGGPASLRGRGFNQDGRFHRGFQQRPMDPDSYVRPTPSMRRGRGVVRKIWEPN